MYLASVFAGIVLLGAVACDTSQPAAPDTAATEAAIRKADADWMKAAQSKKVDDWVAFYAEDVVVLPPNDKTLNGKGAARKLIGDLVAIPGLVVTWEPTKVEVAKSGDLGYLYGTYQLSMTGPDSKPVTDKGKILEIWKKQADGSWKCVVDTWSSDLPPAGPPPAAATKS
jgi:ketosteroid isomerase-like protein